MVFVLQSAVLFLFLVYTKRGTGAGDIILMSTQIVIPVAANVKLDEGDDTLYYERTYQGI